MRFFWSRHGVFRHMVMKWWLRATGNLYLAFLFRLVPSMICWQVWQCRNMALFEGKVLPVHIVQQRVLCDIVEVFAVKFPEVQFDMRSWDNVLSTVRSWCRPATIRLVKWCCPIQHFKLNTDGCSLGNPGNSGGGGILRDSHGEFQMAFAVGFGVMHSFQAELKVLLFGVRLVVERGFHRLHLELDSLTLIRMLSGEMECPWKLARELDELKEFKGYFCSVTHCYREGNMVADALAKVGAAEKGSRIYEEAGEMPRLARGQLRLDKLGVPQIRRSVR